MNLPRPDDYIDIHTHGSQPGPGLFVVNTLMVHENNTFIAAPGVAWCAGIHPWHLSLDNSEILWNRLLKLADNPDLFAIGEAGFDRLRGPSPELQSEMFSRQALLAEKKRKPLVIHCVKAWEELLAEHSKISPSVPWLVHGFRGSRELAMQLVSRNIFLSFWFDFVKRPAATGILLAVPREKIFLETDGSGTDIGDIYKKVAADLILSVEGLRTLIYNNFMVFAGQPSRREPA